MLSDSRCIPMLLKLIHIAPAAAHSVPREPGQPGTDISGVYANADKWSQNNLFCIHSYSHRSSQIDNQTDVQPKSTHAMIQDGMVWITNQVDIGLAWSPSATSNHNLSTQVLNMLRWKRRRTCRLGTCVPKWLSGYSFTETG
jgi:hypothetical protein